MNHGNQHTSRKLDLLLILYWARYYVRKGFVTAARYNLSVYRRAYALAPV